MFRWSEEKSANKAIQSGANNQFENDIIEHKLQLWPKINFTNEK